MNPGVDWMARDVSRRLIVSILPSTLQYRDMGPGHKRFVESCCGRFSVAQRPANLAAAYVLATQFVTLGPAWGFAILEVPA